MSSSSAPPAPLVDVGALLRRAASAVRTFTQDSANSWFQVDLQAPRRLQVTHYCLRTSEHTASHKLRNWRLEGSNDGSQWTTLRNHSNDSSLSGQPHSVAGWAVDSQTAYRYLRVFQHGKSSSNDNYLMCNGLELYGDLHDSS